MGTRSAAAEKKTQPTPTPAPEEASPAIKLLELYQQSDGSFAINKMLTDIESVSGKTKREHLESSLANYYAPDGLVEMSVATYDLGWRGKVTTAATALGWAVVAATICEIAGAVFDIPQIRFVSMLSRKVLGD